MKTFATDRKITGHERVSAWLGTSRLIETGETDHLAAALQVMSEGGGLEFEAVLSAILTEARSVGDARLENFALRALDILDERG